MKSGRVKRSEPFFPSIIIRKWFNIKPKVHDFSEDEVDSESEDDGPILFFCAMKRNIKPFVMEAQREEESKNEASGTHRVGSRRRLQKRKSETLRVQYISKKEVTVMIGTWNVAGKPPLGVIELDELLCTSKPAEMYIIGFQEVVPLNVGNVLGAEDRTPIAKWETIIRKTLNQSPQPKTLYKSFSAPSSYLSQMLDPNDVFMNNKSYTKQDFEIKTKTALSSSSSNNRDEKIEVCKLGKSLELNRIFPINEAYNLDWPEHALDLPSQAFESHIELQRDLSTSTRGFGWIEIPQACASQGSSVRAGLKRVYHSSGNLDMLWSEQQEASDVLNSINDNFFKTSEEYSLTKIAMGSHETDCNLERSKHRAKYVRIASKQMVGIYVTVWVNRKLRRHINNLKVFPVGIGLMGYMGNKGSVSVSMTLHQTRFCFVCSHLTSGHKVRDHQKRNSDVYDILERTKFSSILDCNQPPTIPSHDRIFWFGDLNYRLNLLDAEVRRLVDMKKWDELMKYDQLTIELKGGRTFDGWTEGLVAFPPTYKYEVKSNTYVGEIINEEKKRSPAWCDRILWSGKGIKQLAYWRSEINLSDHRPVSSMFLVEVEVFDHRKLKRALNFTSVGLQHEDH